jgi:CHASE3 domain sensor protein
MHIIRHRLALCGFIFTGVFLWLVGYIVYQLLAEKREGKIKKEEKEKFRTKAQTVEAL